VQTLKMLKAPQRRFLAGARSSLYRPGEGLRISTDFISCRCSAVPGTAHAPQISSHPGYAGWNIRVKVTPFGQRSKLRGRGIPAYTQADSSRTDTAPSMFDYTGLLRADLPPASAKWTGFPRYNFVGGHNDAGSVPVEGLIEAAVQV